MNLYRKVINIGKLYIFRKVLNEDVQDCIFIEDFHKLWRPQRRRCGGKYEFRLEYNKPGEINSFPATIGENPQSDFNNPGRHPHARGYSQSALPPSPTSNKYKLAYLRSMAFLKMYSFLLSMCKGVSPIFCSRNFTYKIIVRGIYKYLGL